MANRLRRPAFWLICGVASVLSLQAEPHWRIQYIFEQSRSSLTITDLKFPSSRRGIASGIFSDKSKDKPTVLVTSDAGEHWTPVPVKEAGLSLFFLDESLGWMVTESGIWQTDEAGRSWRKISKHKDLLRVQFLTREHGFAVGALKQMLESKDGGATWLPVPAASALSLSPENTVFGAISFIDNKRGFATGWNMPASRRFSRFPDWMDPETAQGHRQLPSLSVFMETRDGGATWKSQVLSMFGHISQVSMAPSGFGLSLVEFHDNFEYPSEVYRIDSATGGSRRVFRDRARAITDVAALGNGGGFMAGFQLVGTVRNSPIPGKLKIYSTDDLNSWYEMKVDYRADAHRAFISAADPEHVWVATDTGMILRLEK